METDEEDKNDKKDKSSHPSPPSSSPHLCEWAQEFRTRVGSRSTKKGNVLKPYNSVKEYVKSVPICPCSCGFVEKKDTDKCEMIKDLIIWEERTRKKQKMEMREEEDCEEDSYEDLYYNHSAKEAAAKRKIYRDLSSVAENLKDRLKIHSMLHGEADDIHKNFDRECLRYLSSKIEEGEVKDGAWLNSIDRHYPDSDGSSVIRLIPNQSQALLQRNPDAEGLSAIVFILFCRLVSILEYICLLILCSYLTARRFF